VSQRLPVSFTRRASRHVEEAGRWWRENRAKAPEALREELEQALQLIASQPEMGAIARNVNLAGVRRILLSRVSYYLFIDSAKHLLVPSRSWRYGMQVGAQGLACEHAAITYQPPVKWVDKTVIGLNERQVDIDAFAHAGIRKPLGNDARIPCAQPTQNE